MRIAYSFFLGTTYYGTLLCCRLSALCSLLSSATRVVPSCTTPSMGVSLCRCLPLLQLYIYCTCKQMYGCIRELKYWISHFCFYTQVQRARNSPKENEVQNHTMVPLNQIVPPGVVTGKDLLALFEHARENGYAIPAVNCTR
jgi:hypothetical protein